MPRPTVHKYQVTDVPIPEMHKAMIAETIALCNEAKAAYEASAAQVMTLWSQLVDVFSRYKDEQFAVRSADRALELQLRSVATELGWDVAQPKWLFDPEKMVFGVLKDLTDEDETRNGEADSASSACDSRPNRHGAQAPDGDSI